MAIDRGDLKARPQTLKEAPLSTPYNSSNRSSLKGKGLFSLTPDAALLTPKRHSFTPTARAIRANRKPDWNSPTRYRTNSGI